MRQPSVPMLFHAGARSPDDSCSESARDSGNLLAKRLKTNIQALD